MSPLNPDRGETGNGDALHKSSKQPHRAAPGTKVPKTTCFAGAPTRSIRSKRRASQAISHRSVPRSWSGFVDTPQSSCSNWPATALRPADPNAFRLTRTHGCPFSKRPTPLRQARSATHHSPSRHRSVPTTSRIGRSRQRSECVPTARDRTRPAQSPRATSAAPCPVGCVMTVRKSGRRTAGSCNGHSHTPRASLDNRALDPPDDADGLSPRETPPRLSPATGQTHLWTLGITSPVHEKAPGHEPVTSSVQRGHEASAHRQHATGY